MLLIITSFSSLTGVVAAGQSSFLNLQNLQRVIRTVIKTEVEKIKESFLLDWGNGSQSANAIQWTLSENESPTRLKPGKTI